jgi:ProP effector
MSGKRKKRASVAAAFAFLVGTFPKTFTVDPEPRKSLKIGVDVDLAITLDGALQRRELWLALMWYCNSDSYLRSCQVGATRIDLDGNAVGVVTAAEAEHARAKLAAKTKKVALAATKPQPPPATEPPKKSSLADLRVAAQIRKETSP